MMIFHSHVSLLEGILKIFQRSRSTSILGLNDRVGTVEPPITSLMRMDTSRRCTKKGFDPMVPQSLDALFHGESKNKMDDLGIPWGTPIFLETSKYAQIILGPKYKTQQSKHEIKRACRPRTSPKHRPIRQPKTSKTPLVLIPATAPTAGRLFLAQAPAPIGVGQTAKFRREFPQGSQLQMHFGETGAALAPRDIGPGIHPAWTAWMTKSRTVLNKEGRFRFLTRTKES